MCHLTDLSLNSVTNSKSKLAEETRKTNTSNHQNGTRRRSLWRGLWVRKYQHLVVDQVPIWLARPASGKTSWTWNAEERESWEPLAPLHFFVYLLPDHNDLRIMAAALLLPSKSHRSPSFSHIEFVEFNVVNSQPHENSLTWQNGFRTLPAMSKVKDCEMGRLFWII